MKIQGKWLGNSFSDFLSNIPNEHLLNQIYMFSKNFDIIEAFDRIIGCNFFFTEDFSSGIEELTNILKLPLVTQHSRKSTYKITLNQKELEELKFKLEPEYLLYKRLKK